MGTELGQGLNRARQSYVQTKTDLQKIAKGAKLDALTLANFAPFCSKVLVMETEKHVTQMLLQKGKLWGCGAGQCCNRERVASERG